MKILNLIYKSLKLLLTLTLITAAIGLLLLVFWTQVKPWFDFLGFWGNDFPQYVHYVTYYTKFSHFPVNAWDYFWHNGIPRLVDLTWIHFTLNAILAKSIGLYEAIKLYPIIFLGIGTIFIFLIFYELSKSVFLALALAFSFVIGSGYYNALFSAGVVLSSTSQMFFPAQLYFLIRFAKGGSYKNLILGSVMSALGLYTHNLMMMFFGFIPSFIFVLFANRETESLISKKTIYNAILFAVVTLTVGALTVWPMLLLGGQGGSTTLVFSGKVEIEGNYFKNMIDFSDVGISNGFVLGAIVTMVFWLFKKRPDKVLRPVFVLIIWFLLLSLTYAYTGNPLRGILFPGRFYWVWSFLIGSGAAILLSPLSTNINSKKIWSKCLKYLSFNILKIPIFIIIISGFLIKFATMDNFINQVQNIKEWKTLDIPKASKEKTFNEILKVVDSRKENVRFWTHDNTTNTAWVTVSDMPLSEGYAHIWTYYSRLWEGWFYGVMSFPNWESDEIPREMAKQQSFFFIDWYGIKYMAAGKGSGEFDVAPHFYDDDIPYIEKKEVFKTLRSVFVVSDDYTSPIISAVKSPVVGFVGNDEAYMVFLKDIAMLNLNTSYLIPVKVSTSIGGIDSSKLANVDILVLYDFKEGGLPFSSSWGKITNFVRNGGKVWVEGGGDSVIKEKKSLPNILPIAESYYGSLGTDWQPGGDLAEGVDFSSLEKLAYRNTPWKVSYASSEKVKQGAKVLLSQKDSPVAVIQDVGKGKILWTGVNFWYRPEEYRKNGLNEVVFIKLFLEELYGELTQNKVGAKVERKQPEDVRVSGQGFSGVVFKENHWPGWVAKVESGGRTRGVPIYTAGPELMYIPVPRDMRGKETKVTINYRGDPFHWFSFFVTILSIFVVLDLLSFKLLPKLAISSGLNTRIDKIYKKSKPNISKWWKKNENDEY